MVSIRIKILTAIAIGLLTLLDLLTTGAAAQTIHSEKSLYRNIVVREYSGRRCLVFTVRRGDKNQTCLDLENPRHLVFAYTRMVFSGLLLNPEPKSILVIGLGGGAIPTTLREILPDTQIDVVEIDNAVVRVARKYFRFLEDERMSVAVNDARVFVKRAIIREKSYDMVILDAFTGDYIPEHLMTVEFLQEVKDLLTPTGVLVANTFSSSKLYHHESVTYSEVFGTFLNFKRYDTGNRVVVAAIAGLPELAELHQRAEAYAGRLKEYGIEILEYPAQMSRDVDWDVDRKPLTDQFSPANLLRETESR